MSFPFTESVDADMFTGIGASSLACFTRGTLCPQRYGHLCVAFLEIFCCPSGSTVRRLSGSDGGNLVDGVLHFKGEVTPKIPALPWDGSYNLLTDMPHSGPQFQWLDQNNAAHSINPGEIVTVPLVNLPGHPELPTDPVTPPGTWLDVTPPESYPPGCLGPFYLALASRQWIDVLQSDGVDGEGAPKYKTNCWMRCYMTPVPAH